MDSNDDGTISGKSTGNGDESLRGTGTTATIWMPLMVFFSGLFMMFNF